MKDNYEDNEICPNCGQRLKVVTYIDDVFNDIGYHYSCPYCGWDEENLNQH